MDDTHHSTGASQNAGEKQPTFESAKVNEPQEFPDGGLRAWLVVLGAFFGLLISFGWTNCVGVFQAYYETHQLQSKSPSTVSWIPAISMFMIFITVSGRLTDKIKHRILRLLR